MIVSTTKSAFLGEEKSWIVTFGGLSGILVTRRTRQRTADPYGARRWARKLYGRSWMRSASRSNSSRWRMPKSEMAIQNKRRWWMRRLDLLGVKLNGALDGRERTTPSTVQSAAQGHPG